MNLTICALHKTLPIFFQNRLHAAQFTFPPTFRFEFHTDMALVPHGVAAGMAANYHTFRCQASKFGQELSPYDRDLIEPSSQLLATC